MTLQQMIYGHIHKHGSLRAAARALKMDPAYLSRLLTGEKTNPSRNTLTKLGLVRVESYRKVQP